MSLFEKMSGFISSKREPEQLVIPECVALKPHVEAVLETYRSMPAKQFRGIDVGMRKREEVGELTRYVASNVIIDGTIIVSVAVEQPAPDTQKFYVAKASIEVDIDGKFNESEINLVVESTTEREQRLSWFN